MFTVCMTKHMSWHVEGRGQLYGAGSLLLPLHRFQVLWHATLLTKPPHQLQLVPLNLCSRVVGTLVFLSLVQKWIRSSRASLVTVACSLVLMLNVLSYSTLLLAFVSYSYFRILSVACLWLLIFDSFVIVYKRAHVFWRHPLPLRLLSSPTSISPPLPTSHFSISHGPLVLFCDTLSLGRLCN